MFKGTDLIPTGQFSKTIAKNGGEDNAFTNHDVTAYFQRVAKDRLPKVMEMEADRMANLRLSEDDVATERKVILEERRTRVDNDPGSILQEQMMAALYTNHPYGIPIIGWEHEIEALDREDAFSFYRRFYAPNNALLVVAGDVEPDEVRRLAEADLRQDRAERLGQWPRAAARSPPHYAPVKVTLEDARAGRTTVQRYYLAPSYASAEPGEAEALDLLMRVAAAGSISKIYKRLVIEDRKAANAGGWYSDSGLDSGRLGFYAIAAENVSAEDLDAGDRSRDRGLAPEWRDAGGTRPRPRLLYRRVHLHLRQPVAHGAPLRLAAGHRHDRRRCRAMARPADARHRRGYPRGGAEISCRQEFGHRLSAARSRIYQQHR